jgi:hypothetical protein
MTCVLAVALFLIGHACAAALPTPLARPARLAVLAYGVGLASVGARLGWRTAPTLAAMHLAWGAGLLSAASRSGSEPSGRSSRTEA